MTLRIFRIRFELEVNPRAKWAILPLVTYGVRHALAPVIGLIFGGGDRDWILWAETALEIVAFASLVFVVYWWFHNLEIDFNKRINAEIETLADRIDPNARDQQVLDGLNRLVAKLLAERGDDSQTNSTDED